MQNPMLSLVEREMQGISETFRTSELIFGIVTEADGYVIHGRNETPPLYRIQPVSLKGDHSNPFRAGRVEWPTVEGTKRLRLLDRDGQEILTSAPVVQRMSLVNGELEMLP